jgi:hypothetical protein
MSIQGSLLRFARSVVQNVISQVTQQLNVVNEQAYNQIQSQVREVVGNVWRGQGADAFAAEINGEVLPNIQRIMESITTVNSNITFATDTIDRADELVRNTVDSLADVFGSVY